MDRSSSQFTQLAEIPLTISCEGFCRNCHRFRSHRGQDNSSGTPLPRNHGFEPDGSNSFTNGRASLRLDGNRLVAIPADGGRPWRSYLTCAQPEAVRTLLNVVLAAPSFQSAAGASAKAEISLSQIAETIARDPDTHSAVHLRRFLWSLYNGHHPVSLWRLKDVLDSHHNAAVVEVFSAWMQGHVPEDTLRHALTASGEMDRWDTVTLGSKDRDRLDDALNAVSDLLNSVPPGRPVSDLAHANELLQQVAECLRAARA